MGKQIVSPGVLKDIGELSDLTTTAKSSLVGAINEVKGDTNMFSVVNGELCITYEEDDEEENE